LRLVGAIRVIAYDETLWNDPADQMRQIRDLFLSYDHPEVDDDWPRTDGTARTCDGLRTSNY
jgi:hypothetical protein